MTIRQSADSAPSHDDTSYTAALERFSQKHVANDYPSEYRNTSRDRREARSISKALRDVPPGGHVLDIPCGSGRLLQLLLEKGCKLTCADSSERMVELAQARWEALRGTGKAPEPRFLVRDVMQTGFADREFDAVMCNRLFHHFSKSETRVRALSELGRISKGPVAVSFFNSFALDSLRFHLKNAFRKTFLQGAKLRNDRIPIPLSTFLRDVQLAGLEVIQTVPVLYGISPLWYVVALPSAASAAPLRKAA